MKHLPIFVLFVLFAACGSGTISQPESYSRTITLDKASMDAGIKDTVDLGTIRHGDIVAYAIHLKNGDAATAVILDVSTDCGCTHLEYDRRPVVGGDSVLVKLNYHSSG